VGFGRNAIILHRRGSRRARRPVVRRKVCNVGVYLHEVLDTWFAEVVTEHCRGKVVMYRYADDFVIGCELESDARRIMKALPQRFAKYGLEINAEKTRMISFRRPLETTHNSRMGRNQARSASWALPTIGGRPSRAIMP